MTALTSHRWMPLGLALALSGCFAVGPDYSPPPDRAAGMTIPITGSAVTAEAPPERWWEALSDPTLTRLVTRAVDGNLDLKIATANLMATRAARDSAAALQYPSLGANAAFARSRVSAATQLGRPDLRAADTNFTETGLGLSWELDLFGRVRRSVEAADADIGQSESLRHQVLVALIADVASNYIDLRGAQLRLDVANQNTVNQRKTYDLTLTLSDAGRGTDLDVARARAQLESTVASVPPLQAQVTADKHNLAVLVGVTPSELDSVLDPTAPLPAIPAFVAVGNPSEMLRRRPDVTAAERSLAGATARIGVATADLYPTVSFSATPSLQALQPGDLGRQGAFAYSVGPSLSVPIFDLGVYARLRSVNANQEAALANFQKTVLTALAEVETAVDSYERERTRRSSLSIASQASGRAAELATTRYLFGAENFLTVLDAEAKKLAAEDQEAQSEIAVAQDLVAIYRALGGGWHADEAAKP